MAKTVKYDATKMGPLSWRQLQLANQEAYANLDIDDDLRSALQQVTNNMSIPNSGSPEINWEGRVQSPIMRNSNGRDYWGNSMWDEQVADANDFENNLSDLRGQNQPWYAQLGAGVLKAVTTFGTTWLDGTVGLIYGIGSAIRNGDEKTGWDRTAQIFHNDVSNALQDFNEYMEEIAPNYKSRDEENNKWYQNLGTMNFLADGLIKNIGFTVGAFYSGGLFTKGLKLAGGAFNAIKAGRAARAFKAEKIEQLVKSGMSAEEAAKAVNPMATAIKYNNTFKALEGAQSGTGAAVAGSLFSAVNEGRIEANQVYRDAFTNTGDWRTSKGAAQEILMNEERVMQEIAANPNLTEEEKVVLQQQTRDRADALLKQAEQNAAQAGMLTLGLNIPILTLDNFKMFGRLYSRGFKQSAKQVGNNVITQEMKAAQEAVKNATTKQEKKAAQQALREAERKAKAAHNARNNARIDDVAENVTEKEGRLAWNEITTGQKLWRGTKMGLTEGNEEMAQAFVSSTAGNMTMPEDPDAYYKALTDPNATIKTNNFLTSLTKGFLDSYGNMDRWEEGAIGFLTGILGMPTFGARANSDSNTYLGRGKMIGLSGGLFGEFSNANYLNRLGAESVKNINAFRDRYKQHAQFLAQSQAFTDAMDGYLQDKNEFAYNNARDNDDFAMIQALAITGRLDEAKSMINFEVDKLTDEDLRSIATDFTTNRGAFFTPEGKPITTDESGKPLQGAWRDANGNPMSETKDGKAEMKRLLKEKQETLNTEIDDYVASLDSVRAQVNNSLDESQVRELAWIDWKGKQWSRRFDESVHNGNFINAIDTLATNTQSLMDQMSSEKNFTENKEYKALKNFSELLSKVKTAKNPMELLGIMGKNNAFYNALFDSIYNNNPDAKVTEKLPLIALLGGVDGSLNAVNEIGKTLADIRFMATAQQQFKKKLDEYLSNPTKLAENRARIDNERQQQQDITETINNKPQNSDNSKLRSFLDMDEDSFKQWEASASMPSAISGISEEEKAMVTEASKMRKTYQRLLANISNSTKLSAEEKKQVAALVTASYNKATSYQNFLDTSNEAYNDPNNALVDAEGLNSTEIANLKQSIIDKNQQVLSELIGDLDRMPDLPKTGEVVGGNIQGTFSSNTTTTPPTTGNSQVSTTTESENERVERERKEKEKKEVENNRRKKLDEYIHELAELFAANKRDTAKTWLWDIANGFIDFYLKNGEFPKAGPAISGAKASDAFERLLSLCDNDSQREWLNRRTIDKLYLRVSQLYNPVVIAQLEKEAAEAVKREQARDKKERENPTTHIVTVGEIEEINNRELAKNNAEPKDMTYWKPTTTEYGIGQAYEKGNYTKFSDRAASMNYDEQTKRRIAAVSQYFNDKGVWDRVNSGNNGKMDVSSKESVVYFKIDPELNKAAGEIVILITDKDGNVLGDIMSKNDKRFANQKYLPNFVAYVEEQYKGHENDGSSFVPVNTITGKPLATKINKCMIGKVPYSNDYVTLNEANDTTIDDTNKQHKYFLGIAVTDNTGKTIVKATSEKAGSLGYIDRMIEQPIGDIVSGTPFLLVKSEGRDVYMCVPFITPVFDEEHYQEIMESPYGSVITKAISEIEKTVKNDKIAQKNKPYRIKDILTELFASSKFYVDYNSGTNTYTFKLEGADFYTNVSFEDNPAEGQLKFSIDDLLQNIAKKGLGLQISRKYINGNESRYGVYFNKAIGSIAKVNIKPMSQIQSNNSGHTSYLHTIDDWFVIDPLDIQTVDGTVTIKRVQAVAPVSTKNNPNAKPKTIVNVVVDNTPVKVDLENKTATVGNTTFSLKNSKAYSEKDKEQIKKAKIAYAKAFAEAHSNSIKGNIITTPFGEFDTKNNAFTNDASASDNDNGLGEVSDNFFADLAGVRQQGQKAGTFNSQVQSTPTTTTQTTAQQQPAVETKQENNKIINSNDFNIDSLDFENNYYVVHQTGEVEAKHIIESGLHNTGGLNGTTAWGSKESIQAIIESQRTGHGHRGSQHLVILRFPKSEIGNVRQLDDISEKLFDNGSTNDINLTPAKYVDVVLYTPNETTQTSEQQSTTPQVSEQAPSTEITREEREEITKNNQVQLPSDKFPSGNNNIGGYLAQISDNEGGSFGRVADTDDGSSSYYRMFDVNGDTAKFEFYAPQREQRAMMKWSSILDTVADYEGDTDTADTIFTVEAGEVKKNSDGRWVVTKRAKLQLVKKEDIVDNVYTDTEAVKRDINSLQRRKNEKRQDWENQRNRKQEQQNQLTKKPLLGVPIDAADWIREHPNQIPTTGDLFPSGEVQKALGNKISAEEVTTDLGITLIREQYEGGYKQIAVSGSDRIEQSYYPDGQPMSTPKFDMDINQSQFKDFISTDENGFMYMDENGLFRNLRENAISKQEKEQIKEDFEDSFDVEEASPEVEQAIGEVIQGTNLGLSIDEVFKQNSNLEQLYNSNPQFKDSVDSLRKIMEENKQRETEQKPEPTAEEILEKKSEESLDKRAEDFGLFDIEGGKGRKVWNVLSDEQKEAIVSKDNLQAVAALECLCTLFDGKKGKFKKKNTDVDGVIAKYKRVTDQPTTLWNKEQEIAWLKKALPQLSNEQRIQIVDGLIKIKDSDNPGYAWGQFYRGLITISSEAASGTLYHEAFHAVIDLLMTEDEYNKLFDAAYQVWGNLGMLGLEEKLAEEFRKFVQYGDNAAFVDYDAEDIKTPIIRGIVRLFRRLKALIQGLSNKQIYLNKLFYDINKGKFADRKIKENILDKVTTRQEEDAQLVLDRNPELASVGTAREYAAYINDIFPNSVEKDIYWHGSNEDFSDGFNTAKRGEGSGALETKKRNDLYLNKQGWASLQYVNGVNRTGSDKNGFAHWNKLWWELKEIMSNGRRENNDWKDIIITDKDVNSIRQAIPNKRGKFDRDKGGTHGKWLKERKADYGYENKSDKEFFEEVFGLQLGKDTFNTWTARNAEVFKAMETTAKGIYPVVINVTNPIVEEGQNTYYEEQRGLFSQADRNGNDAILSRRADNEFNSDVAVVINANNKNVHWLGTKSDIEQFRQWKAKNIKQPKFDINERELEDIKKKAIADGTFMKAPNGKPTNLNERQWLQVRTKAFKDWFGDWEKIAPKLQVSDDKKLQDILQNIANSKSRFSTLAQFVLDNHLNPHDLGEVLIDRDYPLANQQGWYKEIEDSQGIARYIGFQANNVPEETFNGAILHEVIHSLTQRLLRNYKNNPNSVPDNIRASIQDLYNIIDYAKKYIQDNYNVKEDSDRQKLINLVNRQNFDKGYLHKMFYAFDKASNPESEHIDEFISEIFTNPAFQEMLNSIPYKETKQTLWDKIKECIQNIFGIPINRGSVLEEALKASTEFINKTKNEYDSVSKVVDENGEPLVVYHGTFADFNTFEITNEAGFHFGTMQAAKDRAPNVRAFFLNIKNINEYSDGMWYGKKFLHDFVEDGTLSQEEANVWENEATNYAWEKAQSYDWKYSDGSLGFQEYINKKIQELKGSEYGVAYTNETEDAGSTSYIVFNPNQVKSATDNIGTFSRENDDIRYSRVKTELDNKVAEFAEAINKSIAETMTLNRYAQNWDYVNKGIPVRKPDASNNDGRKAYFGIKNPIHFYKGQWTISNGASKKGGKSYHEAVKNEVFRRLAMVGMLDKFNALFDVTWNDATNHYVINLKSPEKIATLSEIVDFDSIPDDVLADMMEEEEKQAKEYSKNREKEILDSATKHTTTLFEGKTKIGLGKLFENMINAGVNRNKVALYRNILDRLGELKNIEVEISNIKDSRFSNGDAAGWYFSSSNSIALLNSLDDSFLEDTIVHEALHAIVANTVKDKEKVDKVTAIVEGIKKAVLEEYGVKSINDIQDSGTRRLFYGLTNADEFISEFFSNSQFHDYVKNKQATWYNRFIDFIKSILGLDVDITKIVKDLLSDFNGQIQEVRQTISMQNQLGTIFRDIVDLSKQAVRPQENTEKQEPDIRQYHVEKLMYENLLESDKEYIKEKGLSKTEYDEFSALEKESFWYCR